MSKQENKLVAERSPVECLILSNVEKIGLIRKFQRIEGNFDCCASTYTRVCQQVDCLWRKDCVTLAPN